ncbi:MAG: hypothetical protein K5696_11835 [Lachnospiraceae bacterium]|nr:hypothetical protein [Lachnospiraceae bacterium]
MTEDEIKKGAREISFHELVGDMVTYKPRIVRGREAIRDDDPYFRVIDVGHDLLMTKKKNKDLADHLPKALQGMILELEAIMKEITLAAMEDDFDYRTQLDRYYFYMIRINYLATLMSFKMGRFLNDRTAVEKYLGNSMGRNRLQEFIKELSVFAEIGKEMSSAATLFMDQLEASYTMDQRCLNKRELAMEQAMTMMR